MACLKEHIVAFVTARRLNEYIRHYETLSYPVEEVHRSHLRAKRSINRDSTVTLKFRAHGRDFHIRLKRDLTTFSNNLIIEGSTGEKHYDSISHIYLGNLVGMFTKKKWYLHEIFHQSRLLYPHPFLKIYDCDNRMVIFDVLFLYMRE